MLSLSFYSGLTLSLKVPSCVGRFVHNVLESGIKGSWEILESYRDNPSKGIVGGLRR